LGDTNLGGSPEKVIIAVTSLERTTPPANNGKGPSPSSFISPEGLEPIDEGKQEGEEDHDSMLVVALGVIHQRGNGRSRQGVRGATVLIKNHWPSFHAR